MVSRTHSVEAKGSDIFLHKPELLKLLPKSYKSGLLASVGKSTQKEEPDGSKAC